MRRAAVLLMLGLISAGCSDASAMTCEEYAALPFEEKNDVLNDLLSEKNLEILDQGNSLGVMESVNEYCGVHPFSSESTQNQSQPLEDAEDWDSERWGEG